MCCNLGECVLQGSQGVDCINPGRTARWGVVWVQKQDAVTPSCAVGEAHCIGVRAHSGCFAHCP